MTISNSFLRTPLDDDPGRSMFEGDNVWANVSPISLTGCRDAYGRGCNPRKSFKTHIEPDEETEICGVCGEQTGDCNHTEPELN
jgi:hypothetical protein